MKIIDAAKMAELTKLAEESPRRRTHFNLHESLDEGIHRLCIAAEPDTVIHPHRHKDKWELFFLLKGAADVYTYDDSGKITGSWHRRGPADRNTRRSVAPLRMQGTRHSRI